MTARRFPCWLLVSMIMFVGACISAPLSPLEQTTPYPTVEMPSTPTPDFGFKLTYRICYSEIVNTFEKTLTRDTTPTGSKTTVAFEFTSDQMRVIYDRMREINYFGYPEVFAIPTPTGDSMMATIIPFATYRIEARNDGVEARVVWSDDIVKPTTTEADNLRGFVNLIMDEVRASEVYQNLPTPEFACV